MDKVRAALVTCLVFMILSVAKPYLSTSKDIVEVLDGDSFSINVSFSTNTSNHIFLVTSFNESAISLDSPSQVVDFGNGGFSGTLGYHFTALTPGKTSIKFTIGNESDILFVNVKPKYARVTAPNSFTVEKGNSFFINATAYAMNVNNVVIKLHFNKMEFNTPSDEIFVGSGSFTKKVSIPFKSTNPNRKTSTITLEICADTCSNTTVKVYNKIFEVNITPLQKNVSIGMPLQFKIDTLNYNYYPNISVDYDEGWFIQYNPIDSIPEGKSSRIINFRMYNDGKGCPDTNFNFHINADKFSKNKTFSFDMSPKMILSINPNRLVYANGSIIKVKITAKAFGMRNTSFAIYFDNNDFKTISFAKDYTSSILKGIVNDSIILTQKQHMLKKYNNIILIAPANNSCLNYEGDIKLKVKRPFELSDIHLLELQKTKIIDKTFTSVSSPSKTVNQTVTINKSSIYKDNTTKVYSYVNTPTAVSVNIENPTNETIFGLNSSLLPIKFTMVDKRFNSTTLCPNQTAKLEYILKFTKTGVYNTTLKIGSKDGTIISKDYQFIISKNNPSLTGLFIFEDGKSSLSILILLITILAGGVYIIFKKRH